MSENNQRKEEEQGAVLMHIYGKSQQVARFDHYHFPGGWTDVWILPRAGSHWLIRMSAYADVPVPSGNLSFYPVYIFTSALSNGKLELC